MKRLIQTIILIYASTAIYSQTPIANAGNDTIICGYFTYLNATPSYGTGEWTCESSDLEIISPNNPQSQINCLLINNSFELIWTETLGDESDSDTVIVYFYRQPTAHILTSSYDSTVCGLTFTKLRAEAPNDGVTGYWYTPDPTTTYTPDEYHFFDTATVTSYGYHDFYWIEENGPLADPDFCSDIDGPLTIHFIEIPEANAGNDTLFCGYTGYLNAIPSVGSGVWYTPFSSGILIEDPHDPGTQITSDILTIGNPTNPYINFIWVENNSNGCSDMDTIKVEFARIPSSEIDFIPAKCFGEHFTIAAIEDSLGTYEWGFFDGIVDENIPPYFLTNPEGGNFQNFVRWENEDTAHIVSLTSTNSWGCQSETNIDTVYEPPIPSFNITILPDTCNQGNGAIIFGDTLGSNSFIWLNTTIGPNPGTPINTVYDLPADVYDIADNYLTYNTVHYAYYLSTFGTANCHDTISIEVDVFNTFEMSCPDDIIVNEPVHLADLEDIYPQGGHFYLSDEFISDFDPNLYEPGIYEIYYNYFDFDTDCLGTCSFNIIVNQENEVNEEYKNDYSIYPNPAKDFVKIETSSIRYDVILTDILGKTILEGQNLESINIADLNNGTYIISLRDENQLYRFKLIVDK